MLRDRTKFLTGVTVTRRAGTAFLKDVTVTHRAGVTFRESAPVTNFGSAYDRGAP